LLRRQRLLLYFGIVNDECTTCTSCMLSLLPVYSLRQLAGYRMYSL